MGGLKKQHDALERDVSVAKKEDAFVQQNDHIKFSEGVDEDFIVLKNSVANMEGRLSKLEDDVEADYRGLSSMRFQLTHPNGVLAALMNWMGWDLGWLPDLHDRRVQRPF